MSEKSPGTTQIPLLVLPIEPGGFHLMFHAKVNGYKANVLIDTGASKTVLDLVRAKQYLVNPDIKQFSRQFTGIGSGQVATYVVPVPKLVIGHRELNNLEMVLIDLAPLNRSYATYDLPRIDMVLGGDLLMGMHAIIDYRNKSLLVY